MADITLGWRIRLGLTANDFVFNSKKQRVPKFVINGNFVMKPIVRMNAMQ